MLLSLVKKDLGAVKKKHKALIDDAVSRDFADSVDIDKAFENERSREPRWDYLLGHRPSGCVVALEPHSAKTDEISTVIAKRSAALSQIAPHFVDGARVPSWLWVASGTVYFTDTGLARRRLDQHGIQFVGRKVLQKHLPAAATMAEPS